MKIHRDGSEFGNGQHFEAGSIFGKNCKFGRGCTFGEKCEFGDGCWFEDECEFGNGCEFGDDCKFGDDCTRVRLNWEFFGYIHGFIHLQDISSDISQKDISNFRYSAIYKWIYPQKPDISARKI